MQGYGMIANAGQMGEPTDNVVMLGSHDMLQYCAYQVQKVSPELLDFCNRTIASQTGTEVACLESLPVGICIMMISCWSVLQSYAYK